MSFPVGKSSKQKYKGVFVAKARVKSVTDLSHQTLEFIGKPFDLAIKVTFDIGRSFDKTVLIFGNFKRDADNSIASIGSAFKVTRFFEELDIVGSLTPTNEIPPEWLSAVQGKECFILDYLVGTKESDPTKGKYYTWDFVSTDEDFLVNDFFKGVQKGYPKNFKPDALDTVNSIDQHSRGDAYEGPTDATTPMEEMAF